MLCHRSRFARLIPAVVVLAGAAAAHADNWVAHLTVDNQFDAYYGTNMTTNFAAGGGTSWSTTYTFTATGRPPTDYLYVATASDFAGAQGFIGDFTNTTTSAYVTTNTNTVWEVFPAGAYQATNPYWPNPWPVLQMPTQSQVDTAIAYAETNGLWTGVSTRPGGCPNGSTPWGFRPGIDPNAEWIWYDSGKSWSPDCTMGFNHDEFLVFRIAGKAPTPASASLLGLAGLSIARRRRANHGG